MEDIIYETKIVTFLDVLGFKHIISETVKPSENTPSFTVNQLALVFNKIDAIISDNTASTRCARFSDSIVVIQKSIPKYESNYFNLIRDIQLLLLREGILIRGAMVKGDIYYNQSGTYFDVFGPAILRAVELEKQAVYPRVIVDGSVADGVTFHTVPHGRKFSVGEYLKNFGLIKDFDGFHFIDYLFNIRTAIDRNVKTELINTLESMIEKESKNSDSSIAKKYEWLNTHWNRAKKVNLVVDIQ